MVRVEHFKCVNMDVTGTKEEMLIFRDNLYKLDITILYFFESRSNLMRILISDEDFEKLQQVQGEINNDKR